VKILITGASGFLGSKLVKSLHAKPDVILTAAVRRVVQISADRVLEVQGLGANSDWSAALKDQHVVIHAAARTHIMKDEVANPLVEYRAVNVDGTLNLARQAAAEGVRRFIFISSIKVNGNANTQPFTEDDAPSPSEFYAQSKWEAEQGLWEIQRETGMELVIIRPPLVYGPKARGNFGSLMRWVDSGIPLPLGAIHNKRSLISLDNLADLILTCIEHPAAANEVFLAGDGDDLSTTELLRGVAKAAGVPSRLIPVPTFILMSAALFLGKSTVAHRLLGSLQVDISKARDLLGWRPPLSAEEGLRRCFFNNSERY